MEVVARERVGTKQARRRCDGVGCTGDGGGGGGGGAEMKPPGGGGVKYGFTSPPGPRLFLRARERGCSSSPTYICVCASTYSSCTCVRCWARVTSHAPLSPPLCEQGERRRSGGERGGGARTRLLDRAWKSKGVFCYCFLCIVTRDASVLSLPSTVERSWNGKARKGEDETGRRQRLKANS